MNNIILNTDCQNFIAKNLTTDVLSILLKAPIFDKLDNKTLVAQIEAKKKCKSKLPTWFKTPGIYYPNKLNIAQTSSEITAKYKSELVNGKSLIDLSGGFGVDSFFFAKKIQNVTHCEIDQTLSKIVAHNFEQLKVSNIKVIATDGIAYLTSKEKKYDWIYIDPSRRDQHKNKVFFLTDCLPNVPKHLDFLFTKSNYILIKTSPLLDLQAGIKELQNVKKIHIVAVENDVKELLWVLEKGFKDEIAIKTINFKKNTKEAFNFMLSEEHFSTINYGETKKYLFEPNAAILKAGAFKIISKKLSIDKIHQHSHLYTSNTLIDFPGRRFEIKKSIPFDKKQLKKLIPSGKANITIRNFPLSVAQIRAKTKLKDGGNNYLFFTTNLNGKHIVLLCAKI